MRTDTNQAENLGQRYFPRLLRVLDLTLALFAIVNTSSAIELKCVLGSSKTIRVFLYFSVLLAQWKIAQCEMH